MKRLTKNLLMLGLSVAAQCAIALDISWQPRFNTGAMYYKYKQNASVESDVALTEPGISVSELTLNDTLPYVGGGISLFMNRFFVDLDIRYAFNGQAQSDVRASVPVDDIGGALSQPSTVVNSAGKLDIDFDRTELAVSLGYQASEHFFVYAGYKQAEAAFDIDVRGEQVALQPNALVDPRLTGSFVARSDYKLNYNGPFLGAAFRQVVETKYLKGVVLGNTALAFLNGDTSLKVNNYTLTNLNGAQIPLEVFGVGVTPLGGDRDGSTVGISLGLVWTGSTPVRDLTYSVGVNGYRYDFDSKEAQDFVESVVRFDVALAYLFDI